MSALIDTPIILYGLVDLANPSFELDANGVVPTGWTLGGTNGSSLVTTSRYHSAGNGIPSIKSLAQFTVSGSAGSMATARQRIAISDIPTVANGSGNVEFAVAAMLTGDSGAAFKNGAIYIYPYTGGTSTPGTGTPISGNPTRRMYCGETSEWMMLVAAQTIGAGMSWVDVELRSDIAIAGYVAGDRTYWDRVFAGALLDFPKGFASFEKSTELGYVANEGDGVVEMVRLRKPRTEIQCTINNIMPDTEFATALDQFTGWLDGDPPGLLAIWGTRNRFTNSERHWQKCYHDPKIKIEWPKGILRRNFSFSLVAPCEGS